MCGRICRTLPKKKRSKVELGTSLAVQWLELGAFTAVGAGSIPSQVTKIPHATWSATKKKKKKDHNHGLLL